MMEIADPCVLNGVNDEGATAAFGRFVQLEIVLERFVYGIIAGADNRSGVIGGYWVYGGPYVSGEQNTPDIVIAVGGVIRGT